MRMSRRLGLLTAALVLIGSTSIASPLERQMRELERLRGLAFARDVAQRTIDRTELRTLIRNQLTNSIPYSIEDYVQVLASLQLVDGGRRDLIDRMLSLYDSQVLAFYDPMTHTYFAVRQLPESIAGIGDASTLRDSVVMHELMHALQDQRFGAADRDRALLHDTDGELAYHALLEGEASLLMLEYLLEKGGQSFDEAVKTDLFVGMMSAGSAADKTLAGSAPRYFVETLKFPYIDGLKLVLEAYRRGGWKELDRMHANPPRTTREVLHPAEYFARFGRGEQGPPPFNPPLPSGVLTVERLGEFHWRFLVGDAADGWLDDRVVVNCDGNVVVETRWENAWKAAAFRHAYVKFLQGRGIEPRVWTDGAVVNVIYSP